jgi:hypothetical protein
MWGKGASRFWRPLWHILLGEMLAMGSSGMLDPSLSVGAEFEAVVTWIVGQSFVLPDGWQSHRPRTRGDKAR